MRLRYSTHARLQLSAIYEYLKERNARAATEVVETIRHAAERLMRSPGLGVETDEDDVRLLIEPQYRYRIFYEMRSREIFIVRVLHRAQDW